MNPEYVFTCLAGEKGGLGTYHYDHIDAIGDPIESFIANDFDIIRKPPLPSKGSILQKFFKNQICPKPVINQIKCTNCEGRLFQYDSIALVFYEFFLNLLNCMFRRRRSNGPHLGPGTSLGKQIVIKT